jgi:hypothetical protein
MTILGSVTLGICGTLCENKENFFMERKSEKICKEGFSKFLLKTIELKNIHWKKVEDDPPDYYLSLFSQRHFAVEVTECRIYCKSIIDKKQVLAKEYINYHKRYIKQIEQESEEKGILRGAYSIKFKYPIFKNSKYKKFLSKLKDEYFQYLQETYQLVSADKKDIRKNNMWISSIVKHHKDKNAIYPDLRVRTAWAESSQNIQIVRAFLQKAINDKKEKLEKKKIQDSKILLLYDSYLLDETATYSFSNKIFENIDYFHTIFIQFAGGAGIMFYSKHPEDFNINGNK